MGDRGRFYVLRYTLTYDTFGRSDAVYIGDATGRMLSQSTYNNVGLLEKLQYGNGISANYEYDTLGRQTKLWYSDYETGDGSIRDRGRFYVLTAETGGTVLCVDEQGRRWPPSPAPRQTDPPQKSVGNVQRGLHLSKT